MSQPGFSSRPRLAVVRPDRVGDVIISSSCLAPIREKWPEAEITWMVRPAMAPLFGKHPRIDRLLLLPDPRKKGWWARVSGLTEELRSLEPDGIVFLHPDSAFQVAAWRAGIPHRLGFQLRGFSWTLTEALPYSKSEGKKHEAEYNFDLLARWGLDCPALLKGEVELEAEAEASLESKLSWNPASTRYAVLNPSAFSPVARWPVEYFAALAEKLLKEEGMRIVISGDSQEDPSALELAERLAAQGGRVESLSGKTSLAELGWLLRRAEVLVTRDTGPSHLAAALGCPVVVIFGRTDPLYGPLRWRPLGERVEILASRVRREAGEKRENYWKRSFASIRPEEVMEALRRVRRTL